jgi:hypothetical protein
MSIAISKSETGQGLIAGLCGALRGVRTKEADLCSGIRAFGAAPSPMERRGPTARLARIAMVGPTTLRADRRNDRKRSGVVVVASLYPGCGTAFSLKFPALMLGGFRKRGPQRPFLRVPEGPDSTISSMKP